MKPEPSAERRTASSPGQSAAKVRGGLGVRPSNADFESITHTLIYWSAISLLA